MISNFKVGDYVIYETFGEACSNLDGVKGTIVSIKYTDIEHDMSRTFVIENYTHGKFEVSEVNIKRFSNIEIFN
jgi:hypothetical protein